MELFVGRGRFSGVGFRESGSGFVDRSVEFVRSNR